MTVLLYHFVFVITFTASVKTQEQTFDPVENLRQEFMIKMRDLQDEVTEAVSMAQQAIREANEAKKDSEILQQKLHDLNSPTWPLSQSSGGFHGQQELENYKQMEQFMKVMAPSSCSKWKELGFRTSDFYMIDPDGNGLGKPPFQVYCDMEYGFTYLHHESKGTLQADKCSGAKCHSTGITYSASDQQITTLMFLSTSCQQHIKIDCFESPLQEGSEPLVTWEDSLGVEHGYWAGRGEEHTCACGFSYSCVNPQYPCNCDSQMKDVMLTDEGFLSDKHALPVRALHVGSEPSSTVQVNFTLGPLRCTERPTVAESHSCEDLYVSGRRTSGFYLLPSETSNDLIDAVYCNMSDVVLNPGPKERKAFHLSDYVKLQERDDQTEERISETKQQMEEQIRKLEGRVEAEIQTNSTMTDYTCSQEEFLWKYHPVSPGVNMQNMDLSDYEEVKLYTLDSQEHAEDPVWEVDPEQREIKITGNTDPAVLLGKEIVSDVDFEGMLYVDSNNDDDYVGFVFSYQSPSKFYLVAWKGATQLQRDFGPHRATVGLQIKLVHSATGLGKALTDALWQTKNTKDEAYLLWRDLNEVGWKPYTEYRWELKHRPSCGHIHLKVFQDEELVADSGVLQDRSLQGGRLGVYVFSQPFSKWYNLIYSSDSEHSINPATPEATTTEAAANADEELYQPIVDYIFGKVLEMLVSDSWKTMPQRGITRLKQEEEVTFRGSTVAEASPKVLSEDLWYKGEDTPNWHKDVASVTVLKNVTDRIKIHYNTAHAQANGMVTPRDFVTLNYLLKEGDIYYIVFKSIDYADMPKQDGFVRAENGVSAMIFKPIEGEPDKTDFTFLLNMDFNLGWVGGMTKALYPQFVQAYLSAVAHHAREL